MILVFRVETEPFDLSSEDGCLSEWDIDCGTCRRFGGDGGMKPGDHFLAVWLPSVETESSSLPYAVVWRVIGFRVEVFWDVCKVGGGDCCGISLVDIY